MVKRRSRSSQGVWRSHEPPESRGRADPGCAAGSPSRSPAPEALGPALAARPGSCRYPRGAGRSSAGYRWRRGSRDPRRGRSRRTSAGWRPGRAQLEKSSFEEHFSAAHDHAPHTERAEVIEDGLPLLDREFLPPTNGLDGRVLADEVLAVQEAHVATKVAAVGENEAGVRDRPRTHSPSRSSACVRPAGWVNDRHRSNGRSRFRGRQATSGPAKE